MIKFQKGSLTVEVAMGLPVLIMVLFTWFDLSVLTYSMGVTDHALTTAVMSSKNKVVLATRKKWIIKMWSKPN